MNLNYAIFKSEPIMTLNDLAQIGAHNKREKKAYNSNPDINRNLTKNNIEIVPLNSRYVKGFKEITKEYEKEHNERMKKERDDRKRTFNQMLNKSQNVVADELLFTATHKFFDNMTTDDIKKWADICMEFVYNDLGYTKEQVLHSVIYLDEKTPHLHCVVVPLVKKYDKRTNTERYTISKKQYIKDKIQLSELQDKYHKRLVSAGYDLERGIKGSNAKYLKTKEFKKVTRYYEQKVEVMNDSLDKAVADFEDKMKTTKNTIIDKDYVKVRKDTFDSMNNVIKETRKIKEFQPKMEQLFEEVNSYIKSHQTLEKENQNMQREIKSLTTRNQNLNDENKHLKYYLKAIFKTIKDFFRHLLQIGNDKTKDATSNEIKAYYDNRDFNEDDIYDIAKETTKEDELFDYAEIPSYMKTPKKSHKEKDGFDMSL